MANNDELHQELNKLRLSMDRNTSIHARLGNGEGDLFPLDPDGLPIAGYTWATLTLGDGASLVSRQVRNRRVQPVYGAPVILRFGLDGVLEVIEEDTVAASQFAPDFNMDVPAHAAAHDYLGPDPLLIDKRQINGLLAMPNEPPDLNVIVTTYHYRYSGTNTVWLEDVVDLTSYVPADDGQQRLAILSLNRTNNSITVTAGDAGVPEGDTESVSFSDSDIAAIVTPEHEIRIAAIRLYGGQTEIIRDDIFADLRDSAGANASVDDEARWLAWAVY
jgi:hypothetical protein